MNSNSSAASPCDNGVRHQGGRSRSTLKHISIAHAFKQHTGCTVTSGYWRGKLRSAAQEKTLSLLFCQTRKTLSPDGLRRTGPEEGTSILGLGLEGKASLSAPQKGHCPTSCLGSF